MIVTRLFTSRLFSAALATGIASLAGFGIEPSNAAVPSYPQVQVFGPDAEGFTVTWKLERKGHLSVIVHDRHGNPAPAKPEPVGSFKNKPPRELYTIQHPTGRDVNRDRKFAVVVVRQSDGADTTCYVDQFGNLDNHPTDCAFPTQK